MARERAEDGRYFCERCGEEFETAQDLRGHRPECKERPGEKGTEPEPVPADDRDR